MVEARGDDVVVVGVAAVAVPAERRHPMRGQQPHVARELVVVRDDHAALTDGKVLVREEAQRGGAADAARWLCVQPRADRVSSVLQQRDPTPPRASSPG